jgi:hypothetical protein
MAQIFTLRALCTSSRGNRSCELSALLDRRSTPNPSLEPTRYSRRCRPGLRCMHTVAVRTYSACLRRASKAKIYIDEPPHFESSSIWCRLRSETRHSLRNLPHVYERSVAALRFRQQIDNPSSVSVEDRDIMKVPYLQAALMEFVAMDELRPVDLKRRNLGEKALKIKTQGELT